MKNQRKKEKRRETIKIQVELGKLGRIVKKNELNGKKLGATIKNNQVKL